MATTHQAAPHRAKQMEVQTCHICGTCRRAPATKITTTMTTVLRPMPDQAGMKARPSEDPGFGLGPSTTRAIWSGTKTTVDQTPTQLVQPPGMSIRPRSWAQTAITGRP